MNSYKNVIILILVVIIFYMLYQNKKVNETFQNIYPEVIINNNKQITGTEKGFIVNFEKFINIEGVKLNIDNVVSYYLKIDNEIIVDENLKTNKLKTNTYYNLSKNNYTVNKIEIIYDEINIINEYPDYSIDIYGLDNDDKEEGHMIDLNNNTNNVVNIDYDRKQITVSFDKIIDEENRLNIVYYAIVLVKYDYNKKFINKVIIPIKNNVINFKQELMKIIGAEKYNSEKYETITNNDDESVLTLNDIKNIYTDEYSDADFIEKLNIMKLLITYLYYNTNTANDKISILQEINDYSENKFISDISDSNLLTKFIDNFEKNIYNNQSNEVKELLNHFYILNNSTGSVCSTDKCSYTTMKLDDYDLYKRPFYYKLGITYVRKNVKGDEVMSSNISTFLPDNNNQLFTMIKDYRGDVDEANLEPSLYEKLNIHNIKNINELRNIIGSNYPNNFQIFENNLNKYVNINEYENKKYSPVQINVNFVADETETEEVTTTTTTSTTTP